MDVVIGLKSLLSDFRIAVGMRSKVNCLSRDEKTKLGISVRVRGCSKLRVSDGHIEMIGPLRMAQAVRHVSKTESKSRHLR